MADQQRQIDIIESSAPEPTERPEPGPGPVPTGQRRRRLLIAAAVVVLLAATALVAFQWGTRERPAAGGNPRPSASPSADVPLTTAQIFETLAPSVVSITSAPTDASGTGVVINGEKDRLTHRSMIADESMASQPPHSCHPERHLSVIPRSNCDEGSRMPNSWPVQPTRFVQ